MELPFTVDQSGTSFIVLIFHDFVVKIPRFKDADYNRIMRTVNLHRRLSAQFREVLPCKLVDGYIIMPRAKGERLDVLQTRVSAATWNHIWTLRNTLVSSIKESGYKVYDLVANNLFYDDETDKLTVVDLMDGNDQDERLIRSISTID